MRPVALLLRETRVNGYIGDQSADPEHDDKDPPGNCMASLSGYAVALLQPRGFAALTVMALLTAMALGMLAAWSS